MQKITPFLWFDHQAEEAVKFYTSIFQNAQTGETSRYSDGMPLPKGTVMTASFTIAGLEFTALNGGPEFSFTPAISFFVTCQTEEQIDALWDQLSQGGDVLMELDQYPFSEKFGWLNDRFGVSWQLSLAHIEQKIAPYLLFVGEQQGHAEEAINFYTGLFKNSRILQLEHHGPDQGEVEGTVMHARFTLEGQEFIAMDSSLPHHFGFTEAVSFYFHCSDQEEVDYFWEKLSSGGEEGQCGWLKDKFGVSWQVVPNRLMELMSDPDREKAGRVTQAMLQMQKIEVDKLQEAYDQVKV